MKQMWNINRKAKIYSLPAPGNVRLNVMGRVGNRKPVLIRNPFNLFNTRTESFSSMPVNGSVNGSSVTSFNYLIINYSTASANRN